MDEAKLKKLRDEWMAQQLTRTVLAELRTLAWGAQLPGRRRFPAETAEHAAAKTPFAASLLGHAISELSYLYARDPVREAEDEADWRRVLWDAGPGINAILEVADSEARLGGAVLAIARPALEDQPVSIGVPVEPEILDLEILPRTRWAAIPDAVDPRYAAAVLVYDGDDSWRAYDLGEVWWLSGTEIVARDYHQATPWCVLPNTLPERTPVGRGFGGWSEGSCDAVHSLRTLQLVAQEILYVSLLQRGQAVIWGQTDVVLGPDTLVRLDDRTTQDLEFRRLAADLPAMVQGLQVALDMLAIAWGLPRRTFHVASIQEPVSAAVISASQAELERDRVRRERIASWWERRVHRVCSGVWGEHGPEQATPLSTGWRTSFRRMPQPMTHPEKLAEVELGLEQGLTSRVEGLLSMQPWRTRDECEEILQRADEDATLRATLSAQAGGHADGATTEPIDA